MKEMRCNNEDRTPRDTSLRDVRMKVKDAQSYDGVIQNTASFLLRVCVCVCGAKEGGQGDDRLIIEFSQGIVLKWHLMGVNSMDP